MASMDVGVSLVRVKSYSALGWILLIIEGFIKWGGIRTSRRLGLCKSSFCPTDRISFSIEALVAFWSSDFYVTSSRFFWAGIATADAGAGQVILSHTLAPQMSQCGLVPRRRDIVCTMHELKR